MQHPSEGRLPALTVSVAQRAWQAFSEVAFLRRRELYADLATVVRSSLRWLSPYLDQMTEAELDEIQRRASASGPPDGCA